MLKLAKMSQDLSNFVSTFAIKSQKFCHAKARSTFYPQTKHKRFIVPDEKVNWSVGFAEYNPINYTAEAVLKKPVWADDDIRNKDTNIKFNSIDGSINRQSFTGEYKIVNGLPQNPFGRTGIIGRGLLGKWGPNHAADPIVTRWKMNQKKKIIHEKSKKPVIQFIAIQRKDTKEWAIPGGMVDANENVSITLKREFGEEALNSLQLPPADRKKLEDAIAKVFSKGTAIYQGYVDDPRNTDNAWMETVAMNYHDPDGKSVGLFPLHAGDDAGAVCWMDVDSSLSLYASHTFFLKKVADLHGAHW